MYKINQITADVSKLQSLFYVHRYDFDDEMEPEIEEAFERFCLESEGKRKHWHQSETNAVTVPLDLPQYSVAQPSTTVNILTKNKLFIITLTFCFFFSQCFKWVDNHKPAWNMFEKAFCDIEVFSFLHCFMFGVCYL